MNRREALKATSAVGIGGLFGSGVGYASQSKSIEEAISACLVACNACLGDCLDPEKLQDPSYVACVKASMDCLSVCESMLDLVGRRSPLACKLAPVCIEACLSCINACLAHPDDPDCEACAAACRACIGALEHLELD